MSTAVETSSRRNREPAQLGHIPPAPTKNNKVDARELGLVSGFLLGRHFFDVQDLHYGYWTPNLEVHIRNLPQAQTQYSDFLLSHLPQGIHRILDVGCGAGGVARRLLDEGYQLDCVSPSPFLTGFARDVVGERARLFECRFEELESSERYDAVLFCESFQYIPLEASMRQAMSLLRPGGYIIISDFFRKDTPGKSPIGGGHKLKIFQERMKGLPLDCLKDLDITEVTAPTLTLVNDCMTRAIRPIWESTQTMLAGRYPWSFRLLRWLFRRRIAKIEWQQLSGARNAENFAKFKSYRFLVYQLREVACAPLSGK